MDVDLARLNPAGVAMDADPATIISILRTMKQRGKGIIGMKILGAGQLRGKRDEALQFALAQDALDCFTIGCENPGELQDLMTRIPAASTSRVDAVLQCRTVTASVRPSRSGDFRCLRCRSPASWASLARRAGDSARTDPPARRALSNPSPRSPRRV